MTETRSLERIQQAYDSGLMLQAFRLSEEFGPLKFWAGSSRTLAGRLASNLGAHKVSRILHWRAYRENKTDCDLAAYHIYNLWQRYGPLKAWEFLERFAAPIDSQDPNGVMHFFTARALVASGLRDFPAAERFIREAAARAPENPWVFVTHSHVLEGQDRYVEALEMAQRGLARDPWYRPGVQSVGHLLQVLDRDEEALQFLATADQHIENMHVTRQLLLLQQELGKYDEALEKLNHFEQLAPLREKGEREWITRQKVTLHCLRRDWPTALEQCRQIKESYYEEMAKRLECTAPPPKLVKLEVPFVRQHHMTCAPATLSAISKFWNKPAEHLEVAESICYDGTPSHSERQWAESHGWLAREFRVTWQSAVNLLNRGVPFTLTTSETTSAHLQAVVGYDEARQTLWIRDPFVYATSEFICVPFLEKYAATGPRGMAMVPREKSELLEDLELPDADLYDSLHEVEGALASHQRGKAADASTRMDALDPGHHLTLGARRCIAIYDANLPAHLECLDGLLEKFPKNGNLNLCKLSCLRELARRDARLELLEDLIANPRTDPIFWQIYAQELRADARLLSTAATWVRWALRYRTTDPDLIASWADILWDQGEFDLAGKYYYLAACAGDRRENFARKYFVASRHLGKSNEGLDFLKARHEKLGPRSAEPTITYVDALQNLGQTKESFEVLDSALARRPGDGALKLFAGNCYARFARFGEAESLLKAARPDCSDIAWRRGMAGLADYQNQKTAALAQWREVLKIEPLAHDAIRAVAILTAETEGREKTIEFLNELCEQFPHCCTLLALRIAWLKDTNLEDTILKLRQFLEVNPADGWAWRDLAISLSAKNEYEEAMTAANQAVILEPGRSLSYSVRGQVRREQGNPESARNDFRRAISLEVDNSQAIAGLVDDAPNLAERKAALAEIAGHLRKQVIFGTALEAYQIAARGVLPPDEVTEILKEANENRPDLWSSWSVLVNQLVNTGKHEEALTTGKIATDKFPLLPRAWLDLARVQQSRLDTEGEIIALRKALEISPGYAAASRSLSDAHARRSEFTLAREVIEAAIAANPLDAQNHGCLAYILWCIGERDEAIKRIRHAVKLEPNHGWAWNTLSEWAGELSQQHLALDAAREVVRIRPGEPSSWLILARLLADKQEQFAALEHAISLNPRNEEAFDFKALVLARENCLEDAMACCEAFPTKPLPGKLLLRVAWIEAERGNIDRAVAKAKAALQDHPNLYWGWQLLSEWQVSLECLDDAAHSAERMCAVAPMNTVPLGYLGDIKLRAGDQAGAIQAFERAFKLDPDYRYAGNHLFELYLAARNWDGASNTLDILSRHEKSADCLAAGIQLAAARNEWTRPLELFDQLCQDPKADFRSIARAVEAMSRKIRPRKLNSIVRRHVFHGQGSPGLAVYWVETNVSRKRWWIANRLTSLRTNGESGRVAILHYLGRLGRAMEAARRSRIRFIVLQLRFHLWWLLKRNRDWLAKDVEGWGKVGYTLTCQGNPKAVVDWMKDWREKPQVESWMLYNLTLMLNHLGRYDDSRQVIRHAVSLRSDRELFQSLKIWAAFEEALAGETNAAKAHLDDLHGSSIQEEFGPLRDLTRLLLESANISSDAHAEFLKRAPVQLKNIFRGKPLSRYPNHTQTAFKRCTDAILAKMPSLKFRLWKFWFFHCAGVF